MKYFKLIKTELLSNHRVREVYKNMASSLFCCEVLMQCTDFKINKVRITLHNDEMQPDIRKNIKKFSEIVNFSKQFEISSCFFSGTFNEKNIDIVIDFSLNNIYMVAEEKMFLNMLDKLLVNNNFYK